MPPICGGEVNIVFVDGGAYTGDTVAEMVKRGIAIEAVAAFEADPSNFERLALNGHEFPMFCWPCALGRKNEVLRFESERYLSIGSQISATGNIQVTSVKLDSALRNFQPTLIKLDVEGAELAVLDGAREVLINSRPSWVVCVYHRAEHLWEIPLWFADNTSKNDYSFYLRAHNAGGTSDHCFYAVTRK